ncbi:hypothetical protein CPB86DRAFT_136222 [Serendipita vermifera]|nr:hypothetical protein CPB86DRAFT_136222 [Serendipita vermifera]
MEEFKSRNAVWAWWFGIWGNPALRASSVSKCVTLPRAGGRLVVAWCILWLNSRYFELLEDYFMQRISCRRRALDMVRRKSLSVPCHLTATAACFVKALQSIPETTHNCQEWPRLSGI